MNMKPIDYSQKANWFRFPKITRDVDTFYIYSTVYFAANEGDPDYATLDNAEMLDGVEIEHAIKSSAFQDATNLFIPYYRQASMKIMGEAWKKTGDVRTILAGNTPYKDITAALDYYFENCNEGRPFIIAGHSQGSAILGLVLMGYFKEHPEYYKRMVAAYMVGFSLTKEDLEANPHMKFATGETDTGVIISWHAEGPKNAETDFINAAMLPHGIAINPLNWKRDETYAPASMNLGSIVMDANTGATEIRDIGGDAQVCVARGTVVTHAKAVANEMVEFSGPESFHQDDYSIFYNNVKDNVAKRIAAYKVGTKGAPDYSRKECWHQIPEITKDVDTFYIFATDYILSSFDEGASDYAALDNPEMLEGAKVEYRDHATAYADTTNVFAPYYRQSGLRYAGEVIKKTGNFDNALLGLPYDDITAALDYYFENCNGGRPFILAGHSQGSAMVLLLLRTYFKDHPEYYARMVAAYTIGYSVTDEYLAANPHLKFTTGECDTGVIIAYNTEGPKNVENNAHNIVVLPHTRSINPLNWKLDETYAPASLNLGSIVVDEKTGEPKIGDCGADAQINLARGVVVTNAKVDPMPEDAAKIAAEFFGPDGRHGEDYTLFYNNIKDNVAKRVAAYLAGQ